MWQEKKACILHHFLEVAEIRNKTPSCLLTRGTPLKINTQGSLRAQQEQEGLPGAPKDRRCVCPHSLSKHLFLSHTGGRRFSPVLAQALGRNSSFPTHPALLQLSHPALVKRVEGRDCPCSVSPSIPNAISRDWGCADCSA